MYNQNVGFLKELQSCLFKTRKIEDVEELKNINGWIPRGRPPGGS